MTRHKSLKWARFSFALFVLIVLTAIFADPYEWIPVQVIDSFLFFQFVPSLLSFIRFLSLLAAGGFFIIVLVTFVTGRLYCSVICPLGILQDVVNRIARWKSQKKRFFKFKKAQTALRITFLSIMAVATIAGAGWIVTWLDPHSLAGRFFTYILKPAVILANNLAAAVLTKIDVYSLHHQNSPIPSLAPVLITLVVSGGIGYFSWKRGRLFCNTICPVGTFLGVVSKYALFKVRFNRELCTRCGKCSANCKSECIDLKNFTIDHSRCVVCFNCLVSCPDDALSFSRTVRGAQSVVNEEIDKINTTSRRHFLVAALTMLTGNRLMALNNQKAPASTKKLIRNVKDHPVAPPGSVSIARFNEICTGCSLCVSACPTHVLQPALAEYGLAGFMQPRMDYKTSFCNFDCTRCGEVCPTSAILPLTREQKHVTQMGRVVFVKENCVVYTDETDCGACSEHCPTKAVKMVPYKNGLLIPEVNPDICIGCGACEYPCPLVTPYKAIYVNGHAVQQIAEKPQDEEKVEIKMEEDFPF
ncbi:4Fe-4S dicluster domain-containing protein [candidate division KSB1 bacterium]|nr:MAG: 4Fe-4S dicluster domain-containing protein [candidate division KSB1 bacterium]